MPLVPVLRRELLVRDAIASPAARARCVAVQVLLEAKVPRAAALRQVLAALREAIVLPMAAVLRVQADRARVQALARIAVEPHPRGHTVPLPLPATPIAVRPDRGPVVPAPP